MKFVVSWLKSGHKVNQREFRSKQKALSFFDQKRREGSFHLSVRADGEIIESYSDRDRFDHEFEIARYEKFMRRLNRGTL